MSQEDYSRFDPNLRVQSDLTLYPGTEVDVLYDRKRCIHAAECGRGLKAVFDGQKTPWIDPDQASAEEVIKVVNRCPTGALAIKNGGPQQIPSQNIATISPDGPVYLQGEIVIQDATGNTEATQTKVALCRCGASANKPYCDGKHTNIKFHDAGPIASDLGEESTSVSGTLTITALKDGPLECSGGLLIRSASGRDAYSGTTTYLCRCGASANKPFCDGAHEAAGFKDGTK
jgi:CDGSH-type Zn-finger protein/uncharacterized Fe-S cluster protein YjdI